MLASEAMIAAKPEKEKAPAMPPTDDDRY